ncbi:MAG: hypothetical protein RLZZ214_2521 [Verrucomicrobiota bacterium]|jgi:hypothetical protein
MKSALLLSISILLCACGPSGGPSITSGNPDPVKSGLGFLPKQAERGTLFQYYQPKADSKWRNNWASRLNLTGVSWNDSRTATLISPSHVVMAAHFTRPADVPVMFHDQNGKPYERFVAKVRPLAVGDIAVAKLNMPLPPEVKAYRLANASEATIGRPVITTDQTKTVSVHRIAAVSGGVVRLDYIPGLNPYYGRNLVVGDSGHPSFLLRNGELVLLETHTTGGPGAGPFYGDSQVQAAIRAAIAEMGP